MTTPVKLENIDAFREALRHYKVSPHAQKVLDEARLVVLSGLAGGGRNTTINYLVDKYGYFFLVSDTTRPPKLRGGVMEQHGIHYYFRTEADMLQDIKNGEFIEAEIIHNQQVSGTSIRELARANATHKIAIHDFEYGGAHNVAQAKPDAFIIGLLPPNYAEWIKRFRDREEIDEQEFINRLRTGRAVLRNMLEQPYFTFVINTTVEQCAADIKAIVEDSTYNTEQHETGRKIATEILQEVEKTLG